MNPEEEHFITVDAVGCFESDQEEDEDDEEEEEIEAEEEFCKQVCGVSHSRLLGTEGLPYSLRGPDTVLAFVSTNT